MDISNGRIFRSALYRFVFQDDFSYARKSLHPLITAATTRKEIIGLKLNVLHLIMEYPNGENKERVKVRKSKLCSICEDVGKSILDSTEHNLFFCECLRDDAAADSARAKIIALIATMRNISQRSITQLILSEPTTAALVILNPTSSGLPQKFKINHDHKCIQA